MDQTAIDLHKTIDAHVWSGEFVRIIREQTGHELDRDWMTTWFANAIMAGFDEGKRRAGGPKKPVGWAA